MEVSTQTLILCFWVDLGKAVCDPLWSKNSPWFSSYGHPSVILEWKWSNSSKRIHRGRHQLCLNCCNFTSKYCIDTVGFTPLCSSGWYPFRSFQQARAPATKSAPTFEDLTIDDKLTEKQRVVRYTKSTIGLQRLGHPSYQSALGQLIIFVFLYCRLVHTKMLAEVAQTIGYVRPYFSPWRSFVHTFQWHSFFDTIHTIIPLLEPLSRDVEAVVKQHLVEQLKTLAKVSPSFGFL